MKALHNTTEQFHPGLNGSELDTFMLRLKKHIFSFKFDCEYRYGVFCNSEI